MDGMHFEDAEKKGVEYGVENVKIYIDGWTPRWSYSLTAGETEQRTQNIFSWDGVTRISKKRVGESLNSVYYDGVRVDVLEKNTNTPYDLDLRLSCLTYPEVLDALIGVAEVPGVRYESIYRHKMFGLSYQTRSGDDGYKIHYYPAVKAIPTEISYSTITSSPELVEFSFDLAVFSPYRYRKKGINSLGITIDTRELSKSLTSKIEKVLYEDATNLHTLLDDVYSSTKTLPEFYYNIEEDDGIWYAWVDEEESSGLYDLSPVSPLGEEFSISVSQEKNNPVYIDEYTWTLYDDQ